MSCRSHLCKARVTTKSTLFNTQEVDLVPLACEDVHVPHVSCFENSIYSDQLATSDEAS